MEMNKQLKYLGGGGGGGAEEAEDWIHWNRRETLKKLRFIIMVGMNGECCNQLAKIVGAAGMKILASRL